MTHANHISIQFEWLKDSWSHKDTFIIYISHSAYFIIYSFVVFIEGVPEDIVFSGEVGSGSLDCSGWIALGVVVHKTFHYMSSNMLRTFNCFYLILFFPMLMVLLPMTRTCILLSRRKMSLNQGQLTGKMQSETTL